MCRSHKWRSPMRNSSVHGRMPLSPWMVSTKIAHVWSSMRSAKLPRSLSSPNANPGHQRAEAFLDLFLRRGAHSAEGAAVKRLLGADDLEAPALLAAGLLHAVQPRDLDQRLVGLGAAVAEKHTARAGAQRQLPREFPLQRIAEQIANVNEFAGLAPHRLHPDRMAVAQRADGDARGEVEVFAALVVPDGASAAANQSQGGTRVVLHYIRIVDFGRAGANDGGLVHGILDF